MIIRRIPVSFYASNCYIIMDEESKEMAIIDPGGDAEILLQSIDDLKGDLKYIILTHAHMDHTNAVRKIKKVYDVPVCINEKDEKLAYKNSIMFGPLVPGKRAEILVKDKDVLKLGKHSIECIETPGHSPGGMCYLLGDKLFTGDTLFAGSIGRTDFYGGDAETLINSIKTKLMILDGDITVLPGHGPESTLDYERKYNPFL